MRATDLPKEWEQLLEATRADDYDEAHRICIKYQFDRDSNYKKKKARKHIYYWTSPSGNQGTAGSGVAMGNLMGVSTQSVIGRFGVMQSDTVEWYKGERKGWKVTRVLVEGEK